MIGANNGDEGKGLITDVLAAEQPGSVVVRANSSAQAGHTVQTPDGRRHVFHHVGAGALAGAATVLGPRFVAHPMLLGSELLALADLGVHPELLVDARTPVAVPFDVVINQLAERARGDGRHGSCGIGFGEAVERQLRPRFALTAADLDERRELADRLCRIRDQWVPQRLATLGLRAGGQEASVLADDEVIERWLDDAAAFHRTVTVIEPGHPVPGEPIFENAQGLLLDEVDGPFPHVTRSRTGLTNVVELARETGLAQLDVVYTTRCYLTRHGAGPLPGELGSTPPGLVDHTNATNPFQGAVRYAWLDLDELAIRLERDLDVRADGITVTAGLAVTHLDQLPTVTYLVGGRQRRASTDRFLADMERITGLTVWLVSHGPRRDHVTRLTSPSCRARPDPTAPVAGLNRTAEPVSP